MRLQKPMNYYERKEYNKNKFITSLAGSGVYVYRNKTTADLVLPKPSLNGLSMIGPGQEFQGDSYFQSMLGKELSLVRVISSNDDHIIEKENNQEELKMNEEQVLILDQPDIINDEGKVEHVIKNNKKPKKQKNVKEETENADFLLTEDPVSQIIVID